MLFDAHAHYNDVKFESCREELLSRMSELGVGRIVNAGASIDGSYESMELSHRYEFMYFCAGIHPESAAEDIKKYRWLERIEQCCRDEKCVAVGEIGLDYYWSRDFIPEQKECFTAQLELARALKLPVVIHDREAHGDCIEIVRGYKDIKGLFHCYSGSVEMARELISMGWYISIGGVVTFGNARRLVEVVEALRDIPEGRLRILLETDAPYLAPVPHRGKLNHSGLMRHTAERIAELWGITADEVEDITYRNATEFYGLKD